MPTTKVSWRDRVELAAITAALDARGIAYETRGDHQLRFDCPACGSTGRHGRRPVLIHRRATGALGTRSPLRLRAR